MKETEVIDTYRPMETNRQLTTSFQSTSVYDRSDEIEPKDEEIDMKKLTI